MGIAITEEHAELAQVVRAFLSEHETRGVARRVLVAADALPSFWDDLAELGWLGLSVAEECGGSGFSLFESAVVAREMGREMVPGPFLSTTAVASMIAATGTPAQQRDLSPGLVSGTTIAAAGIGGSLVLEDGNLEDDAGPALAAPLADLLALVVEGGIYVDQDSRALATLFLYRRMHTIAGSTSEIAPNVIGERVLGLPREPRH